MPQTSMTTSEYEALLRSLKQMIRSAQLQALRSANREQIQLYMDIGQMIVERQEGDSWGRGIVATLAVDLQREFPNTSGFSSANLWRMKGFFEAYGSIPKLAQLVREIGWSHNIAIFERCKSDEEREFYLRSCRQHGWTRDVLLHQIENRNFQRTLASQHNFDATLPQPMQAHAKLAIKDEYTFGFLDFRDEHTERELEQALTGRVEAFLREMGDLFAFIGSQYKIRVGDRDFYIDLLLYHRKLRCLVALELKLGEFTPEHLGKMQFYLTVLDDTVRLPEERPSIGIILCKSKDRLIVEYALRPATMPVGIASYQVTQNVPVGLEGQLPEPGQIASLLAGFDG